MQKFLIRITFVALEIRVCGVWLCPVRKHRIITRKKNTNKIKYEQIIQLFSPICNYVRLQSQTNKTNDSNNNKKKNNYKFRMKRILHFLVYFMVLVSLTRSTRLEKKIFKISKSKNVFFSRHICCVLVNNSFINSASDRKWAKNVFHFKPTFKPVYCPFFK